MATINKIPKKIPIAILLFLMLGTIIMFLRQRSEPVAPEQTAYMELGGEKVKVQLALTPAEQEKGLSGREGLASDEGLLFVFRNSGKQAFWMKDMRFPIDIIWLAPGEIKGAAEIVYMKENASPASYPEVFTPDLPAQYVLEVQAGFVTANNIKVGDKASFTK